MNKIMELSDDYARASYNLASPEWYDHERKDEARTALVSEVERMEAEVAKLCGLVDEARAERNFLQKVSARRAARLEQAGLHADCTAEEADALKAEIAALREDAEKEQAYAVMPAMRRSGMIGTIEVSLADNCLHGRLVNSGDDLITYEGNTPEKLLEAFKETVDKYLDSARGIK